LSRQLNPIPLPAAELHVWHARIDSGGWPPADALPAAERERAARLLSERARRRWVSARWALRDVLGRYLHDEPAEIELRFGDRGKPMLAASDAALRFNLSHSGAQALIAVTAGREVGIDVQAIGPKPAEFYAEWTQREAIAKCHGVGLWAPLHDTAVTVTALDAGASFAAAIAVNGEEMPPLRHFAAEPG
jgi:phosphopantetheinyl transferase